MDKTQLPKCLRGADPRLGVSAAGSRSPTLRTPQEQRAAKKRKHGSREDQRPGPHLQGQHPRQGHPARTTVPKALTNRWSPAVGSELQQGTSQRGTKGWGPSATHTQAAFPADRVPEQVHALQAGGAGCRAAPVPSSGLWVCHLRHTLPSRRFCLKASQPGPKPLAPGAWDFVPAAETWPVQLRAKGREPEHGQQCQWPAHEDTGAHP